MASKSLTGTPTGPCGSPGPRQASSGVERGGRTEATRLASARREHFVLVLYPRVRICSIRRCSLAFLSDDEPRVVSSDAPLFQPTALPHAPSPARVLPGKPAVALMRGPSRRTRVRGASSRQHPHRHAPAIVRCRSDCLFKLLHTKRYCTARQLLAEEIRHFPCYEINSFFPGM